MCIDAMCPLARVARITITLLVVSAGVACWPEIGEAYQAAAYQVELQPLTTISDSAPGALGELRQDVRRWVVRDGRGRLFTAGSTGVAVFAADASFITLLGRRGQGPGEFMYPASPLVGSGDSIHVFDHLQRRVTVFSPELEFVRVVRVPHSPSLVLEDGFYVVAEQLTTPEHAGYPLHLMTPDGDLVGSFGADTAQHRADLALVTTRVVGLSRDGTVWAAPPGRYVIERWDPRSGRKISTLIVASDWFQESDQFPPPGERPNSIIQGIWEDAAGLLWVQFRVADVDWRPGERAPHAPHDPREHWRTYDTVLEVIDPETGLVLASRRFDETYNVHPQDAILASHDFRDPANVSFELWTAQLRPR